MFRASPEATFKYLLFSESLLDKVMVKPRQAGQEFLLHSLHILREDASKMINLHVYMNWAI